MTAQHERQLIRALAARLRGDRRERDELIRRARAQGVPVTELARDAGVAGSRIYQILEGDWRRGKTKGGRNGNG